MQRNLYLAGKEKRGNREFKIEKLKLIQFKDERAQLKFKIRELENNNKIASVRRLAPSLFETIPRFRKKNI